MAKRILIVDDIMANIKLLEAKLSSENYNVNSALSGEEALSKVGSYKPNLITIDPMMPSMNGFDLCLRLRERDDTRHTPIIFLSALTDESDRIRAYHVGADAFFSKPLSDEIMMTRISSLIKRYSPRVIVNRKLLILKLDTLLLALQENIDLADRKNIYPSFDLALHEDGSLLEEVRRLVTELKKIRALIEVSENAINEKNTSVAAAGLREFIIKFSGSFGEGLGTTITWGSRVALSILAIETLNALNIPINEYIDMIKIEAN